MGMIRRQDEPGREEGVWGGRRGRRKRGRKFEKKSKSEKRKEREEAGKELRIGIGYTKKTQEPSKRKGDIITKIKGGS